jgi:hypothetical protein
MTTPVVIETFRNGNPVRPRPRPQPAAGSVFGRGPIRVA